MASLKIVVCDSEQDAELQKGELSQPDGPFKTVTATQFDMAVFVLGNTTPPAFVRNKKWVVIAQNS